MPLVPGPTGRGNVTVSRGPHPDPREEDVADLSQSGRPCPCAPFLLGDCASSAYQVHGWGAGKKVVSGGPGRDSPLRCVSGEHGDSTRTVSSLPSTPLPLESPSEPKTPKPPGNLSDPGSLGGTTGVQ